MIKSLLLKKHYVRYKNKVLGLLIDQRFITTDHHILLCFFYSTSSAIQHFFIIIRLYYISIWKQKHKLYEYIIIDKATFRELYKKLKILS